MTSIVGSSAFKATNPLPKGEGDCTIKPLSCPKSTISAPSDQRQQHAKTSLLANSISAIKKCLIYLYQKLFGKPVSQFKIHENQPKAELSTQGKQRFTDKYPTPDHSMHSIYSEKTPSQCTKDELLAQGKQRFTDKHSVSSNANFTDRKNSSIDLRPYETIYNVLDE